jgi:DNA modification methylase
MKKNIANIVKGFETAESRWARFGPYYAMFPVNFAFDVVDKYSEIGDYVIDPFSGRCSSVYAAGVLGRYGVGIEINPVGWLYGKAKLNPAEPDAVMKRLSEIYSKRNFYKQAMNQMPEFYRMAYCDEVLKFLLAARKHLDWENNGVDTTLMAIILVYMHGKLGEGMSNQMQMTKAMGVQYSINWWRKNHLEAPPEVDPFTFIKKKIDWRYEKGIPALSESRVILGDSTTELKKIVKKTQQTKNRFKLLLTSPPYYSVTNYYTDQWLRMWLLGGSASPTLIPEKHKARFIDKEEYYSLLDTVFCNCAALMEEKSTVYVRTDKREYTFTITLEILKKHFPEHSVTIKNSLFKKRTQTEIHGNKSSENGEIDIILKNNRV